MFNKSNFKILNEKRCDQIVCNVYKVLGEVGCIVRNKEAMELLIGAGCVADGELVRIPKSVIDSAVASAPGAVTLYDRFGETAFIVEPGATFFGPHLGCPKTVDLETGETRLCTTNDAINTALVSDALPNISWAAANGQLSDVDARIADVHEARAVISNTTKPITTWAITRDSLKDICEMCEIVVGGSDRQKENPNIFVGMCPVNCLTHGDDELDVFLYAAERGLPLLYTPGMMLGVQTPVTMAAGIVMGLCDTLLGLVVSQLKNPGTPFVAANFLDATNMNKLSLTMTAPEVNIASLCSADVFRYLGIPFCSHATATDANSFDQQAAADSVLGLTTAISGGCNMVIHLGYMSGGLCSSIEALVFADEVISMLRRMERGIEISDETLAFNLIQDVGPNGSYIAEEHTIEHFRELWSPSVFSRDDYDTWVRSGKEELGDKLNRRAKEIIARGPKNPLPLETIAKLDAIVERAERRVLG